MSLKEDYLFILIAFLRQSINVNTHVQTYFILEWIDKWESSFCC